MTEKLFLCRIFKGLDEDHDGKVSNAELKTFLLGIQLQADTATNDDFVENIMDQFDISGNESIEENEFVIILTKWLQEVEKPLSQNDYNPLTFLFKRNQVTFYLGNLKNLLFCFWTYINVATCKCFLIKKNCHNILTGWRLH